MDISGLLQLLMFVMPRFTLIPDMSDVFSDMQMHHHSQQTSGQVSHFKTSPKISLISDSLSAFCVSDYDCYQRSL